MTSKFFDKKFPNSGLSAKIAKVFDRKDALNDAQRIEKAGGIVDIGPECFALADGSVLSYKGENYVPQKPSLLVRFHNWRVRRRNNEKNGSTKW